jgi:ABC-type nitrate/sulfonate/bicarbonate transport system permease component
VLLPALVLAGLLGLWEIAARWDLIADPLGLEPYLVPAPSDVATALWEDRSLIAESAWVTLGEVVLGFACALVAGTGFAVLLHLSPVLRRAFYPLLVASQAVPVIALAPILILWLGYGLGPKLVIIALVSFFPVTVNTLDGLRRVDPAAVKLLRTLYASRWQIFRRLEAPTALPSLFSGAKIAIAVAVIGAVFAEWSAPSDGLGYMIFQDSQQLATARMFAAIAVLSLMAITLFGLVAALERRTVTWKETTDGAR